MIKIINWSSFQSYKDRKPPWIRLHKTLLDNYEFHAISANARALLPMLWLLASEDEDPVSGSIRYGYDKIAFRLRMPINDVEAAIQEMADSGFIDNGIPVDNPPCNETVTESLRNGRESVTPETYRSRHIKTETEKGSGKPDKTIPYETIISYLNEQTGKSFKATTETTRGLIRALWAEGFREEEFRRAIENQTREWKGDPEWERFLQPSTLFRKSKFEGYVNNTNSGGKTKPRQQYSECDHEPCQKVAKHHHFGRNYCLEHRPG